VCCGLAHTIALTEERTLVCWGFETFGQCVQPHDLENVVAVSSSFHNLALKADGELVGWGLNVSGQSTVPECVKVMQALTILM
jgi:alpha-tubulin suppressor-like RCC1 family protein